MRKRLALLVALAISLLIGPVRSKPDPVFVPGHDTTYVDAPVDVNGFVDYETALNERLRKGITPEQNANVLLWQALGPKPEGAMVLPEVHRWMGVEPPPEKGDYFIGYDRYLRETVQVEPDQMAALLSQQGALTRQTWSAADYPEMAAWLEANAKPLALVREATRRRHYFNPLVSRGQPGEKVLLGALLPSVQKCREVALALTARALLKLSADDLDSAWDDLLTCHRLGRLMASSGTLIEALVGLAVDQVARNADVVWLAHPRLTADQARTGLSALQHLLPIPLLAGKVEFTERLMFLDCVQLVRRGGFQALDVVAGGQLTKTTSKRALRQVDWGIVMRLGNRWYDRLAAILRVEDYFERVRLLERVEMDLKNLRVGVNDRTLKRLLRDPGSRETAEQIGTILVCLLMPAICKVQDAADRIEQGQRHIEVAFALALYRCEHGQYPDNLGELAPKYLGTVPRDLYSGADLVYQKTEDGYLMYSVGKNGFDEGGRHQGEDPAGDDLRICIPPAPELARD